METEQTVIAYLRARGADVDDAEWHLAEADFWHSKLIAASHPECLGARTSRHHIRACRNACVVAAMEVGLGFSKTLPRGDGRFDIVAEAHVRVGTVQGLGPTPFAALAALAEAK